MKGLVISVFILLLIKNLVYFNLRIFNVFNINNIKFLVLVLFCKKESEDVSIFF